MLYLTSTAVLWYMPTVMPLSKRSTVDYYLLPGLVSTLSRLLTTVRGKSQVYQVKFQVASSQNEQ